MLIESAAAVLVGASVYSFLVEPYRYQLRHYELELMGPALPWLKVLHLSDFHFYKGQERRRDFLHRLAEETYDFVFITGDLIDNDSGIALCHEALRPLKAKYGIYSVLGNHDYTHVQWHHIFHRTGGAVESMLRRQNDVPRLIDGLREMGIVVLCNQRREVEMKGGAITVAGVDDPYLQKDDVEETFRGYEKNKPCFVLIHTPDRYQELAEKGAEMVFCGHTHGGQVRMPFVGPVITRTLAPRKFAGGLVRVNGTYYHTSKGLGSGPLTRPRFLCPPEVNLFTIRFTPKVD